MKESKRDKNGKMKLVYLKLMEKDKIKIDKITDYYELFVKMLKTEDKELQPHEHLWVLGIDAQGYSTCVYVVSIGYSNFSIAHPMKIFRMALQVML